MAERPDLSAYPHLAQWSQRYPPQHAPAREAQRLWNAAHRRARFLRALRVGWRESREVLAIAAVYALFLLLCVSAAAAWGCLR